MDVINGDLLRLALGGRFDVIIHGCNCFCVMDDGIAKTVPSRFFHKPITATAKQR